MRAFFHPRMRRAGFGKGEGLVHHRGDRPFFEQRPGVMIDLVGDQRLEFVRGRSVDPVSDSRLRITVAMLISAFSPPSTAIVT